MNILLVMLAVFNLFQSPEISFKGYKDEKLLNTWLLSDYDTVCSGSLENVVHCIEKHDMDICNVVYLHMKTTERTYYIHVWRFLLVPECRIEISKVEKPKRSVGIFYYHIINSKLTVSGIGVFMKHPF